MPLPASEQGFAQSLTGHNGLKTVPSGWSVLVWNFPLAAGASADMTIGCPAGLALADLESGQPSQAPLTGLTYTPSDFIPFYGVMSSQVTVAASQPATVGLSAVCMPSVKGATTVVHGRSPVRFPTSETAVGLRKGAPIPRSWRVYKTVIRVPVSAGGVVSLIRRGCPGDTQSNDHAISRPGKGGTTLPNNGFALAPASVLARGAVTVYTLCSSMNE
jgi:hypothetical protein